MLKKIDAKSENACHNSLNIFSIPATGASVRHTEVRELLPQSGLDEKTTKFEFRLHSDNRWLDLSTTYLCLNVQLEKMSGQNWVGLDAAADKDVGVIQSLGPSFVQQLKIHMGGTEVYDSTKLYPFISYIRNELLCSRMVKDTSLAAGGYYHDTRKQDKNSDGFKKRAAGMSRGKNREFRFRLDFDLANQDRYILNNMDIVFTVYRSPDKFLVHSLRGDAPHVDPNTYRINLKQIRLQVAYVDVQPSVNVGIARTLENTSAAYPMRKIEAQSWFLTPGRKEYVHNIYTNTKPRSVILAFLNYDAFNGSYALDGFNFQTFGLCELVIYSGGQQYPAIPYEMEFDDDARISYARAYQDLIDHTSTDPNITNGITPEQFVKGFAFFKIPMTSTLKECEGFEPITNTSTVISAKFKNAVANPGIEIICLGEFDEILYIDATRRVTSDGKVG